MMASSPSCLISTISGFLPERLCPEPGWHWGQDTRTDLLDHLAFEHFAARCQRKGLHSDKKLRHVVFRQTCIGEVLQHLVRVDTGARHWDDGNADQLTKTEIGRASCRERVCQNV